MKVSIQTKFRTSCYAGIYMITFPGSDCFYIGSSVDIAQRERRHRHAFRSGTNSKALQAAWEAANGQWAMTTISQRFTDAFELRQAEASMLHLMWDAPGRLNKQRAVYLAPQWSMGLDTAEQFSEARALEWSCRSKNYRGGAPRTR